MKIFNRKRNRFYLDKHEFPRKQRLTMRARGRLDSHRQNELILALGFIRFVGESTSLQPPVTRAVDWLSISMTS